MNFQGKMLSYLISRVRFTVITALLVCVFHSVHVRADMLWKNKPLSLEQKVGQLIMPGIPGTSLDAGTAAMIDKYHPGGILFYGKNTRYRDQILRLTSQLQKNSRDAGDPPLFISIDQEGGRVKRITDSVTQFPGNMALGAGDSAVLTGQVARVTGIQLRLLGINMNLAPSVDVNTNPRNPIINIRSFGSSPEKVACHGEAYIRGLQRAHCMAVAKHFPGHGNTEKDSHTTLPVVSYGIDTIETNDLYPFRRAFASSVSSVMSAHILFPALDRKPATLSPRIMTDLLKQKMAFQGLVITDDLEMGAIAGDLNVGEASVRALLAGADILLISTHARRVGEIHNALVKAVKSGRVSEQRIDESVNKILKFKTMYMIDTGADEYRNNLSDEDVRLLMNAETINAAVSAAALYLYVPSEENNSTLKSSKTAFVYTDTLKFQTLCRKAGIPVFSRKLYSSHSVNVARLAKKSCNDRLMPDEVLAYYEVRDADEFRPLPKAEPSLVLISPDNAFLVSTRISGHSALFSFSDTTASYRAIVDVVSGRQRASRTIPLDLGFSGK